MYTKLAYPYEPQRQAPQTPSHWKVEVVAYS